MASGAKKKAARRKKEKKASPTNPNPNPNSDSIPSLHHRGDDLAFTTEEGGMEESFETPMWHPDGSGNVSSPEILRSDRNPAAEGSVESYGSQTLETYVNGLGETNEEDHVLDGEGSFVFVENPDDHLVGSEVKEKETTQIHEDLAANNSVSLGKEVKIVPWPDEEMPSVDFEGISNGGDVGLKDLVLEKLPVENSVTEPDEGGGNELTKIEESLEETESDELAEDASEGSKVIVENVNLSSEGQVEELIHVDEAFEEAKLEKSGDEKCMYIDNYALITEELIRGSKAKAVNLDKSWFSVIDTSEGREVRVLPLPEEVNGEPDPDAAARIEFVPRNEVARGPLVVRRATLWNCCGLLDVLTGSER